MTRSGDDALGDDDAMSEGQGSEWFTPRNGLPAQRSEPVDEEMGTRHDRYSQSVTDWLETRGVNMPGLFTGEIPLARVEEEGWGQDLLGKDIHIGRVREIDPSQALKPSDVAAAEVWDSPTFWELAMDEGLPTTLKTGEGYAYLDEGDAEGEGVIAGTRTLRLTAMALDVRAKASDKTPVEDDVKADERTPVKHKAADGTDAADTTAVGDDAPESTDA
jgi:hypothetical protein